MVQQVGLWPVMYRNRLCFPSAGEIQKEGRLSCCLQKYAGLPSQQMVYLQGYDFGNIKWPLCYLLDQESLRRLVAKQ